MRKNTRMKGTSLVVVVEVKSCLIKGVIPLIHTVFGRKYFTEVGKLGAIT